MGLFLQRKSLMSNVKSSAPAGMRPRDSRENGARVSPDRPFVGIAAIVLVTIIMLASMVFSFTAITEAAAWTHNPLWSHPLAAVFIDGAILTYTISYAVFRWRGQDGKRTLAILVGFTTLSFLINVIHAGAGWEWDLSRLEAWGGMAIAGAAPFAALLAAEEVTRLTFVRHDDPLVVEDPVQALAESTSEAVAESEPEIPADVMPGAAPTPKTHPNQELPRSARPRPLLTFNSEG